MTRPTPQDDAKPGQDWSPPPARLHNAWNAAARKVLPNSDTPNTSNKSPDDHLAITIKNDTGSNIAVGDVVGFGDPLLLVSSAGESQRRITFEHASPVAGKWAVAANSIKDDFAGQCVLVGIAWAQVNVTDANHTHADISGGSLVSGDSGYAKILYKPNSTGTDWCCLQLGLPEGSGGGGAVDSQARACVCSSLNIHRETVDVLQLAGSIGVDEASDIRANNIIPAIQTCGCTLDTIACTKCSNLIAPDEVLLTIADVADEAFGGGGSDLDFSGDPLSDFVNGTHTIALACVPGVVDEIVQGSVTQDFLLIPMGPGGIGGDKNVRLTITAEFRENGALRYEWRIEFSLDDIDDSTNYEYSYATGQSSSLPDCFMPENDWTGISASPVSADKYMDFSGWSATLRS